jgi:hypothetical protein
MNTYTVCLQSFRTRFIKNQNLKKPILLPFLYTYWHDRKASESLHRPQLSEYSFNSPVTLFQMSEMVSKLHPLRLDFTLENRK